MPDSNQFTSSDYKDVSLPDVKSGCLKVFQTLGAFHDQLVLIGGLVPALLIDQSERNRESDPAIAHVGTRDVDIGFSLGLIEEQSYDRIVERLVDSGFTRDENENGNPTNHRWITGSGLHRIKIDFQIPMDEESTRPGGMQNLTGDLSAVVTPGLELAFRDVRTQMLEGETPGGDQLERSIQICGPASLITLKGLAINEREKWKDYYDIYYLLRNWPDGLKDLADEILDLHQHDSQNHIRSCIENLKRDFESMDHVGPRNVARFVFGEHFEEQPGNESEELLRQSEILVNELLSKIEPEIVE